MALELARRCKLAIRANKYHRLSCPPISTGGEPFVCKPPRALYYVACLSGPLVTEAKQVGRILEAPKLATSKTQLSLASRQVGAKLNLIIHSLRMSEAPQAAACETQQKQATRFVCALAKMHHFLLPYRAANTKLLILGASNVCRPQVSVTGRASWEHLFCSMQTGRIWPNSIQIWRHNKWRMNSRPLEAPNGTRKSNCQARRFQVMRPIELSSAHFCVARYKANDLGKSPIVSG